MTDDQQIQRAQQEYGVKTGAIPTNYEGGRNQSVGDTLAEHGGDVGTAIGLTGALLAQPEITALAPFAGRALKAGGQYLAGRKVETPSIPEVAGLTAESVIGAGAPKVLNAFARSTVPHVSPLTGQFIKGISGSGVPAWAGRTAGEAAHAMTGPTGRAAAFALPDQIRKYLMERLSTQGQP